MSFTDRELTDIITQPYVGIPLQFSVNTSVAISWNDIIEDESELPPVTNELHETLPSTSIAQQIPFIHHVSSASSSATSQNNNQRPSRMSAESIQEARQLLSSPMFSTNYQQQHTETINWSMPLSVLPHNLNKATPLLMPQHAQGK